MGMIPRVPSALMVACGCESQNPIDLMVACGCESQNPIDLVKQRPTAHREKQPFRSY